MKGDSMNYKGYDIDVFFNGFTVFFEGDELYFNTEDEAKSFIDSAVEAQ